MRLFSYFIFLLFPYALQAQVQRDSTALVNQMDSISSSRFAVLDSVPKKINQPFDSLNVATSRVQSFQDSISTSLTQPIDSLTQKLSSKIDSLNLLKLPTEKYVQLRDSLRQLGPAKTLAQAQERVNNVQSKVNSWEGKVTKPVTDVERKINDKLSLMRSEGGEQANLPGNVDLPGSGLSAPGVELPSGTVNEGGPMGEGLSLPGSETPKTRLPNLKPDIPVVDELGKINEGIGEVTKVTGEVSGYAQDAKNIGSGNLEEVKQLPTTLEKEAVDAGGLEELQTQSKVVDEYKNVLGAGNNREALKQQALQQAPKLAKNHFKGQEAALQGAIDKMSGLKKKYAQLEDMENIPKYAPNAMKGKPFVERLVPGVLFQIQKKENVLLDYSLTAGYRISGRLTAGLGWNERIGITSRFGFTTTDRIYGPRTFVDIGLKKGFSVRVDAERMHAFVPPVLNANPSDLGGHDWIWGVFTGIKKQYDFVKNVKGNFQVLYSLYTDHDRSPYTSRFNVRFGFEFPIRKKAKAELSE